MRWKRSKYENGQYLNWHVIYLLARVISVQCDQMQRQQWHHPTKNKHWRSFIETNKQTKKHWRSFIEKKSKTKINRRTQWAAWCMRSQQKCFDLTQKSVNSLRQFYWQDYPRPAKRRFFVNWFVISVAMLRRYIVATSSLRLKRHRRLASTFKRWNVVTRKWRFGKSETAITWGDNQFWKCGNEISQNWYNGFKRLWGFLG